MYKNKLIRTPSGLEPFAGVRKIVRDCYQHLSFDDGSHLKCSIDHRIALQDGVFIEAQALRVGDIVKIRDGSTLVTDNRHISEPIELFDIIESGQKHEYYTNSVVSHNCSFVGSSYTLISGDKLKHMKEHYKDPVKEEQYGIKVFYPPEPDHKYLISVDTAEGKKLDYTAFVVLDITTLPYRVVATYYSNEIDALLFPAIVYYAHRMYHEAELFIELNSTGQQVAQILWDEFATDNIIRVQTMGQKGQVLLSGASTPTKMQLGIKQSTKTKRLGCANLKTLIESDYLVVEAEEVIDELMRFVVDNQSYSAEEGAHDDLVMCLVNFGWLNGQSYFRRSQSGDVRTMLQEQKLGTSDTELMLLPAPMVTNGLEEPKHFFADGATWNEVANSY